MSLLLEALKKAELAKQTAKAESSPAVSPPEPTLEPAAPVMTRERLPDISQPLEILSDDLPSSEKRAPLDQAEPSLSMQEAEPRPAPEPMPADEPLRRVDSERAQAQRMFQVKEMDYNPRRPFYLTIAALVLVGVGYSGYVWWQLQPKTSLTVSASSAGMPRAAPVQAAVQPAPPASPAQAGTPAQAVAPAQPGKTAVPPISPVRPSRPAVGSRIAGTAAPGLPRQSAAADPAPPRASTELPPIATNPPSLILDPLLDQAYQAFQRGDLAFSREAYLRVLAREPNSRDALLGMAAIELRAGNLDIAEARYVRLLEMNPRDSHAVAGLVALRNQLDPVALESRLKTMIASQPEAAHLHFSLGNQYARQSRWPEAQAAYFKAYSAEPENADYAFNLAVSLDQLQQRKPALDYYQRALELATRHPANFSRAQTQARIQDLSR